MNMNAQALSGGFAQPVLDAQAVFRLLMDCMSRPGTARTVMTELHQPAPLGRAAGAVALTLCDADTPVWLQPSFSNSPVPDWITFHTGAKITRERGEAKFAFKQAGAGLSSFDLFELGTQEYPDRSTTIVVEVQSIEGGRPLTLKGPGIQGEITARVAGLPDIFTDMWKSNGAHFPRGVDLILTAGSAMLCLPRTTEIV